MTVKPIPAELLTDSISLLIPHSSGYSKVSISLVKVLCRREVTDYVSLKERDISGITVYVDMENSIHRNSAFEPGYLIEYDSISYEIYRVEPFSVGEQLHHIRISARRVN